MTKLLIIAATLGFAVSSAAAACDFHKSASKTDETTVASISADNKTQDMSNPVVQPSPDGKPIIVEQPATE